MVRQLTSASNLHQREACPGSAFAESGIPNEDSPDSVEGTILHSLDDDHALDRSHLTGEQADVLKASAEGDERIFSAVRASLSITENSPFVEGGGEELWFRRGIKRLFPGHTDKFRFYPDKRVLVIIDKKFGRREVAPAEANRQLMAYAVMGAEQFNPEHVLVALNQPRLAYDRRLTIGEYNRDGIRSAKEHLLRIWDGAHNADGSPREDAIRIAGESQCRYCRAKLSCPTYREKYEFLAKNASGGKAAFVSRIADISDGELDKVYIACRFASLISDAAKSEILARQESGRMLNYESQETGSIRTVTDVKSAADLLQLSLGLSLAEVMRHCKLSLEGVADELRVKDGISQKEAKDKVRDTLENLIELKPKAPSLKRTGEPQPALS